MDLSAILIICAAYFLGGVPTGYIAARWARGIDIREHGSGNPGAANTYRVVGWKAGLATLIVDALKGYLPVAAALHFVPEEPLVHVLTAVSAVVGHNWTVFLHYRGGKGVATSAGVFAALAPWAMPPTFAVFLLMVWISGHISVGSMAAAAAFPLITMLLRAPAHVSVLGSLAAALILLRHIPNLKKLLGK